MQDLALVLFSIDFKWEMVLLQGFISFALLLYWVISLWEPLLERANSSRANGIWLAFCVAFGGFLAIASALDWGTEFILMAFSIGLSIGLAMVHPTIAVCLLTSLLFLRPWELIEQNDYFAILPKLTFSLCIAHVFLIFAEKRKLALTWGRTATILVAFAAWAYMSTFKSSNPALYQGRFFDVFFKSVFLFMMITNVLTTERDLRILKGTIVITFLAVGLISIYQTIELADATQGVEFRLKGIGAFSNANDIAALMVLVFPFSMTTALRKEENLLSRISSVALMAVVLFSIHLSQSRGAMLALGITLLVYLNLRMKKRWIAAISVALGLTIAPIVLKSSNRDANDLQQSSSSRMTYIKTGIMMGLKNPVLGVGYEAYEENFENYATEILYEWGHRSAHNSWILTFAETGFLGFGLFVALFVSSFAFARRITQVAPEFLLSLIGYGIAMSFLSHSYLLYPYLLYGIIEVAHKVFHPSAEINEMTSA